MSADFVPESLPAGAPRLDDDQAVEFSGLPKVQRQFGATPFDHMLVDMVMMSVPVEMLRLQGTPMSDLRRRAVGMVDVITSTADRAMFGGEGCGAAAAQIARAIALLAVAADGGVTVFGYHWCTSGLGTCGMCPADFEAAS